MKLMTKAIEKVLPALRSTIGVKTEDKVAVCKFFGGARYTFFVTEGSKMENGDFEFFGYCKSNLGPDCDEWGNIRLSDLKSMKFPPFGLPIERDLWWTPTKISKILSDP